MNEQHDLESLLRYFRIEERDLDVLARLKDPLEDHADALVQGFYEHLENFPETKALLADREVRGRLLAAQRKYLLSLADPVIDQAYVDQRTGIGIIHEKINLSTRWYLGAYSLYFDLVMPVVRETFANDEQTQTLAIVALEKRLLFDAEIAIRQYIDRREQELRRLNESLRAEGRSLTREVAETHQDLRRTEVRAQEAEQLASVGTLISGLAHEIGTPMSVIRGHAEALGDAVVGDRATWRLTMILEQIDRITGIIQALLGMARPRKSQATSVSLAETLDSTLAFLTEKQRRRGVEVERKVSQTPNVVGDPQKLQQVFLNLMINAIDAMPEGGRLGVQLDHEGDASVVRITDTGAGIARDELDRIFEPFYSTKAAGRGNGLGLVVVQGIVDEHGGTLDVRSELGAGTEFIVRFPVETNA